MVEIYALAIFLFGTMLGSFMNVCIYRVPRKLSVASPKRSFCPTCNRTLAAWENVPILSWLYLRGKCSTCKTPISFRYPFVEFLAGVAGVAVYLKFGLTPTAGVVFLLVLTLITISFIDLDFKIIPNVISFPGITIGLLLGIVSEYTTLLRCSRFASTCVVTQGAADSLFGMLLGGGFFYVISYGYYFVTKRVGLGGGDIKLLAMTGAILGVASVAPTIFYGSFAGAVIGVTTMFLSGSGRHTEIPFGPWLSLGAIIYIFTDLPFFKF